MFSRLGINWRVCGLSDCQHITRKPTSFFTFSFFRQILRRFGYLTALNANYLRDGDQHRALDVPGLMGFSLLKRLSLLEYTDVTFTICSSSDDDLPIFMAKLQALLSMPLITLPSARLEKPHTNQDKGYDNSRNHYNTSGWPPLHIYRKTKTTIPLFCFCESQFLYRSLPNVIFGVVAGLTRFESVRGS